MDSQNRSIRHPSPAHLLAGILLMLLSVLARADVIDNIELDDSVTPPVIQVNFTLPLRYINHTPTDAGDELHIQLERLPVGGVLDSSPDRSLQPITFEASRRIPLRDASYEQRDAGRGVLTLRFRRTVRFRVQAGADRRHLVVSIVPTPADRRFSAPRAAPTRPGSAAARPLPDSGSYVINLESNARPVPAPELAFLSNRERYLVYQTRFPIDGRIWYRTRLGFFRTRQAALRLLAQLKDRYPRAWVTVASRDEIHAALTGATAKAPATATARPRPKAPRHRVPDIQPSLPRVSNEKIEALMEQARKAVAEEHYGRAIQLYTKVLRYPDHPYRQQALEYLAVTREKKGQFAHAIREYERYLSLYPEGEAAARVRQRLAGLTTAARAPLPATGRRRRAGRAKPWDVYGGISQFYRRDQSTLDNNDELVTQSSLSTDLDITARRRGDDLDVQTRFTGSYLHDFLNDGPGDESSVSSLYLDATHKRYGLSLRLGRQSHNTDGVLGRFDGLLLAYRLTDWLTLKALGGYPVLSTRDSLHTNRTLYGVSMDLGTFANTLDFNAFFVEQQVDGILDRRAVGGEARYFDPVRSLLGFVDYDLSYDSLNTLIVLGTWTLPDRTTLNATLDYRNSPILTTTNALQGQTVTTIDKLLDSFTEDEVRALAEDRTAESTTVTLGATHPLSQRLQVSGDITLSRLGDTKASGGVAAQPGTDNDFFYNFQLIGSSLIKAGDIAILGLRYADTSTSKTTSLSLNTRYPFTRDWRINPRLRVDYRKNSTDDSTQWIGAPSLRMDYRWRRRYRFEAEGGGEWSSRELTTDSQHTSSWFFSLGYRADF